MTRVEVVVRHAQLRVGGRERSLLKVVGEMVDRCRGPARLLLFFQSASRLPQSVIKSSRIGEGRRGCRALPDNVSGSADCGCCGFRVSLVSSDVHAAHSQNDGPALRARSRLWERDGSDFDGFLASPDLVRSERERHDRDSFGLVAALGKGAL